MGTAQIQGELWGAKATDWAELGEGPSRPAYDAVFARAGVRPGTKVIDLGCGAGAALVVARGLGAAVAGMDASEALVAIARSRLPGARIELGDLEELPFEDAAADLVTGFNSFQFAGDIPRALAEARRICRPGGAVAMCVWGQKDECESVAHTFTPVMALLPPPPPATRPPLGTPGVIEGILSDVGLTPLTAEDVDCPFLFPDAATAWRTMASAGLMVGAIRQLGEDTVRKVIFETLKPFTRPDGTVLQRNRFHWVMARRP